VPRTGVTSRLHYHSSVRLHRPNLYQHLLQGCRRGHPHRRLDMEGLKDFSRPASINPSNLGFLHRVFLLQVWEHLRRRLLHLASGHLLGCHLACNSKASEDLDEQQTRAVVKIITQGIARHRRSYNPLLSHMHRRLRNCRFGVIERHPKNHALRKFGRSVELGSQGQILQQPAYTVIWRGARVRAFVVKNVPSQTVNYECSENRYACSGDESYSVCLYPNHDNAR